ncbi:MAG: energy transducer TonB [Campylobacterota bacterium]
MNTKTILISFLLVLFLHYLAFSSLVFQPQILNQTKVDSKTNELINIKLASIKKEAKKIEKEETKKKSPVKKTKPITKPTKAPIKTPAKKITKKPQKKIEKKQQTQKEVIKEEVKEKEIKQVVKKASKETVETKPTKSTKSNKSKNRYLNSLREEINQNKYYPRISKRLKEQGIVNLSFRVLRNGKIKNIKLEQSSQKRRLDEAAIKAIKDTSNYKPFPKEIKNSYIDINLKIGFTLK